ncbi:MAG: RNA-binding component of cleavage and polyadenylation factor [Thelocarpon superellum]|nr:MAG: RNA-binding component of cleavage and polyadenylation factor [Thelocarpon superellum]
MATEVQEAAGATSMNPKKMLVDPLATPPFNFAFSDFLKREYRYGLNPNRPICKAFIQGHCPLGDACPDRHTASNSFNSLVCKHWLRGLCKKGDACEFLHEYNLRKMPECNFFRQHRYCSNGDECLYLHIDPDTKLEPCPHYDKGFCPLGPRCSKKHERRALCPLYLAGFCPYGRTCKQGAHARWPTALDPPTIRVEKDPAEVEREMQRRQELAEQADENQRDRGYGGRKDWGGGRGGRNRGSRGRRGGY